MNWPWIDPVFFIAMEILISCLPDDGEWSYTLQNHTFWTFRKGSGLATLWEENPGWVSSNMLKSIKSLNIPCASDKRRSVWKCFSMPSEHEKRHWAWLGCTVQRLNICWVSLLKHASWASLHALNAYNAWLPLSIYNKDCNPWSIFKVNDLFFRVYDRGGSVLVLGNWQSVTIIIMISDITQSQKRGGQ